MVKVGLRPTPLAVRKGLFSCEFLARLQEVCLHGSLCLLSALPSWLCQMHITSSRLQENVCVQCQMYCTDSSWCDFVIRTEKDLHIEIIYLDRMANWNCYTCFIRFYWPTLQINREKNYVLGCFWLWSHPYILSTLYKLRSLIVCSLWFRSFNYAYKSFFNLCTVHPIRLLTGEMEQLKARQSALDTLAPAEESSSPE